jgi:hypothetical protein
LLFPLVRLARWVVRNEAAARGAEGVIDFAGRRYMIDLGGYAVLHADGRQWSGASGRRLGALLAEKPRGMVPLSLPNLLDGVRAATEVGVETVRGVSCRHFQADVDPSHASSVLSDDDWPTESIDRPVDVGIDHAHVRWITAWAQARAQTSSSGTSGSRSSSWTGLGSRPSVATPEARETAGESKQGQPERSASQRSRLTLSDNFRQRGTLGWQAPRLESDRRTASATLGGGGQRTAEASAASGSRSPLARTRNVADALVPPVAGRD